jgi:hypothetical protein
MEVEGNRTINQLICPTSSGFLVIFVVVVLAFEFMALCLLGIL